MYVDIYFCDTLTSNSIVNLDILIKDMIRRYWERYDQTILRKVWSDDIEKGMIRRYWERYDQTILRKIWSDDIEKGMIRRYWEWQLQYQSRLPKEIGGVHLHCFPIRLALLCRFIIICTDFVLLNWIRILINFPFSSILYHHL